MCLLFCLQAEEWIAEKAIAATAAPPPSAALNMADRYSHLKRFETDLESNKDKIECVIKSGEQLMVEQPQLAVHLEPRMQNLRRQWLDLNTQAAEQSSKLAESHREQLFDETSKSLISWVTEVKQQIVTTTEEVTEEVGLVELNEQIKEHEKKEQELAAKRKMLDDMAVSFLFGLGQFLQDACFPPSHPKKIGLGNVSSRCLTVFHQFLQSVPVMVTQLH